MTVDRRLTHSSHYQLKPGVLGGSGLRQDEADETIIFDKQEPVEGIQETAVADRAKLIRVEKIDVLRDSLEGDDGAALRSHGSPGSAEIAEKVESGILPRSMFCLVEKTGELIDVEFDDAQSKCYLNTATKEYYRPII